MDTCKTGKISGIRKLIGGCSQLRHFKLLCCMNVQCWCQTAAQIRHLSPFTFNLPILADNTGPSTTQPCCFGSSTVSQSDSQSLTTKQNINLEPSCFNDKHVKSFKKTEDKNAPVSNRLIEKQHCQGPKHSLGNTEYRLGCSILKILLFTQQEYKNQFSF